jgi:hypothetical protein
MEAAEDKGRWIESAIEKRVSFGLAHFLMLRIERILRRAALSPPLKLSQAALLLLIEPVVGRTTVFVVSLQQIIKLNIAAKFEL